jgi:hypothetical protein
LIKSLRAQHRPAILALLRRHVNSPHGEGVPYKLGELCVGKLPATLGCLLRKAPAPIRELQRVVSVVSIRCGLTMGSVPI